jgi:hypothetical protein
MQVATWNLLFDGMRKVRIHEAFHELGKQALLCHFELGWGAHVLKHTQKMGTTALMFAEAILEAASFAQGWRSCVEICLQSGNK